MKSIICCTGRNEYPKVFLFGSNQEADSLKGSLFTITQSRLTYSVMIDKTEFLGKANAAPPSFQSLPVADFLENKIYKGIVVKDFPAEIALLQEVILHLATEGTLDGEKVAPKFDTMTKLVALGMARSATRAEMDLAQVNALRYGRRILAETKK